MPSAGFPVRFNVFGRLRLYQLLHHEFVRSGRFWAEHVLLMEALREELAGHRHGFASCPRRSPRLFRCPPALALGRAYSAAQHSTAQLL